jgi:hypothetical protein
MANRALCLLLLLAVPTALRAAPPDEIHIEASEARAVLDILAAGPRAPEEAWQRLFSSPPYRRLEARERAMRRDFTPDDFRRFVLSHDTRARREALARTLAAWMRADLPAIGARVRAWLPAGARLRATVYPVIKPQTNSFVFDTTGDPAIFLYVDPETSAAEFESTVAHELHHIGLASLSTGYDVEVVQKAPAEVRPVLTWIGAFGEGLAVLAAAGSTDVHPLRDFEEADRIRWDQDMKGFASDVRDVETFFLDILRGGFRDEETIRHVAMHFFGYRGPWYTVGYRMAALVEQRFGRQVLLDCMADPRELLWRYNEAAANGGPLLPRWSDELLQKLGRSPRASASSGR